MTFSSAWRKSADPVPTVNHSLVIRQRIRTGFDFHVLDLPIFGDCAPPHPKGLLQQRCPSSRSTSIPFPPSHPPFIAATLPLHPVSTTAPIPAPASAQVAPSAPVLQPVPTPPPALDRDPDPAPDPVHLPAEPTLPHPLPFDPYRTHPPPWPTSHLGAGSRRLRRFRKLSGPFVRGVMLKCEENRNSRST